MTDPNLEANVPMPNEPCRCGCSRAIHIGPDGECETCGCEAFGEYDGPRESPRTDGRSLSDELHEAAQIQRWR